MPEECNWDLDQLYKLISIMRQEIDDLKIDTQNLYRRSEGWPILPPDDDYLCWQKSDNDQDPYSPNS